MVRSAHDNYYYRRNTMDPIKDTPDTRTQSSLDLRSQMCVRNYAVLMNDDVRMETTKLSIL